MLASWLPKFLSILTVVSLSFTSCSPQKNGQKEIEIHEKPLPLPSEEVKPGPQPEPQLEPKPTPTGEVKPGPQPEPQLEPKPTPTAEVQPAPNSEHNPPPVELKPMLGVKVLAPKEILYVQRNNSVFSRLFLAKNLFSSPTSENLYRTTGSGGLGEELNDVDSLIPYDGIPLSITQQAIELSTMLTTSGDKVCENLFHFNENLIIVNTSQVINLTKCNVTFVANGKTKTGDILSDTASFSITFNPTFKTYADANDLTFQYLRSYSHRHSADMIAQWLKESEQTSKLSLNPAHTGIKIKDLNALTGAQNLTSLDLSGTDVKDLSPLLFLKNLKELDLSGSKVEQKDLAQLSQLPKLKVLKVRSINISDIKFITHNIKTLTELDVSDNPGLLALHELKNLTNLMTLRASNSGLTSMKELAGLSKLLVLDLSNNNLSGVTLSEFSLLSNLNNVTSLDLSKTKIKDELLNSYFDDLAKKNNLTKLSLRNSATSDCSQLNVIDNLTNISKLTQLRILDIHGSQCGGERGFSNTNLLSSMSHLEELDISNTSVSNLSGIRGLSRLKKLTVWHNDGHILMKKEQCIDALKNHFSSRVYEDCDKLRSVDKHGLSWRTPGSYVWTVPRNVYQVSLKGCSGANGGAGGGGGGAAGGTWALLPFYESSYGGDGGSSGSVNGQSVVAGSRGSPGIYQVVCVACGQEILGIKLEQPPPVTMDNKLLEAKQFGGVGGDGGIGYITKFSSLTFSAANSGVQISDGFICQGGVSGLAGLKGENPNHGSGNLFNPNPVEGYARTATGGSGGHGASPSQNGWNSKIETHLFDVRPGENINIVVGSGGIGGAGGSAGQNQNGTYSEKATNATPGTAGSAGANGFLEIEWKE